MRTYVGITCYILADDVLILGTGMKMVSRFAEALNATHRYLHLMGAKVAPGKSYILPAAIKLEAGLKQPCGSTPKAS